MSKSDQWIGIFIVFLILIHIAVLLISIIYHKISWIPILNSLAALSVVLYWVQKQFRISVHILYPQELVVVSLEVIVIASAAYLILSKQSINWLAILQKIIFGINVSVLLLFLVFMFTFKIKRLI